MSEDPTPGDGTPYAAGPPTGSSPRWSPPAEEWLTTGTWPAAPDRATIAPEDTAPGNAAGPFGPGASDDGSPVPGASDDGPPVAGVSDDGGSPVVEVLALPLTSTAALVGEYRWIEEALYRLLGQWVTEMPVAAVQVLLDGQSMRHAWHAELWAERLPVHVGADPVGLTTPSPQSAVLLAALSGEEPDETVAVGSASTGGGAEPGDEDLFGNPGALPRLAGLYRVALPRLVTSYERHLRAVAPATDAPVARALRLVLNDEIDDWRTGERLVQRLVTRPHDVVAVHEYLQRLESAVVGAGAVAGLVTFPDSVPAD